MNQYNYTNAPTTTIHKTPEETKDKLSTRLFTRPTEETIRTTEDKIQAPTNTQDHATIHKQN